MKDVRGVRNCIATLLGFALPLVLWAASVQTPSDLALVYLREVERRLEVPPAEQAAYAASLEEALRAAGVVPLRSQYVVLVDRNPNVQAVTLFWRSSTGETAFIGASPTSTGRPGGFEHFETPVGIFAHSLDNLDFRAEGTRNELGIRGYGEKGMRVYDFGWVEARRTWGTPAESPMRLQMHSTDPQLLEPRLGTVQSKGCIRIPATLNDFIDRYGILDADYEQALAAGRTFWVLRPDRTPTPWSGRYLVVVDSTRKTRPPWSPLPARC
ncbi:MAG TPA: murein L,D-transpeptidase [Burkholderiaceae bacterium]|nr:murein L,D-transpeptidase [Burkholderiaceae bacterium]